MNRSTESIRKKATRLGKWKSSYSVSMNRFVTAQGRRYQEKAAKSML